MDYEVIVIGAGPAGISAAIYLGRAKVKTLMVGMTENSQLALAHKIENYFGFPEGITGKDLLNKGIKQIKKFDVKLINGEVVDAKKTKKGFTVKLGDGSKHNALCLVIATGTPIKLSGIENEEKYMSKGVQYCVECDGAFFQKKKVVIVGNGNHAADDAIDMKVFTNEVSIVSNAEDWNMSPQMAAAMKKKNIKLVNKKIKAFQGNKFMDTLEFTDGDKMKVSAAFMACGTASALDFSNHLGLKIEKNILLVDHDNKTNLDGVFAAGNCCARCRQVAKNVGDGCNAGLAAIKYLRHRDVYFDYSMANSK